MEDETLVEEDTLDTPEEETETVEEEVEQEVEDEEEVDWKSEAEKARKLANNYKVRAEKAEKKAKTPKVESTNGLSTKDILALAKANVHDDDLDEVLDYAAHRKMSVAQALESSVVKAIISENTEKRNSAAAVNTGTSRRAGTRLSDERLLADSEKGILPESDEDMSRLTRLRLKR